MKSRNMVILMAAALIICGAANLHASNGSDHIKFSSDYASLQEAVDSTRVGDVLYIDRDYTLTDTLRIKKGDITIIGTKSVIQPESNGYPSPLIQVNNLVDSTAGLAEEFRWIGGVKVPAFRIPYMTGNRLPVASKFRKGSLIFVSDSNKVKISNGTNWINLN